MIEHKYNPPAVRKIEYDGPYTFQESEFDDFLHELHCKYPMEWIAMAIDHEDPDIHETTGTIFAHDRSQAVAMRAASDFHEANPDIEVHFFLVDIGSGPIPPLW